MLYLWIKDCKELIQNKKRMMLIILVLIILLISTYYNVKNQDSKTDSRIRFGVADEDSSVYSKMLITYFKENESFSSYVKIVEGSSKELEKQFYNGNLDLFFEIPDGFAEKMMYLDHLPVKVLISTADVTKAVLLKNILDSYEKYIRAVEVNCLALFDTMQKAGMDTELIKKKNVEISYDLIFTALGKDKFFNYREITEFPASSVLSYYSFALLSVLINFMGLYVGFLIWKEKKSGILRRLYTVGITAHEFLLEKLFFSTGVIFVILSAANILPGLYFGKAISIKRILLLLSASLFSVCFAVFFSGLFHEIRKFMIAGNFICFLFGILGGGIIPIPYMPEFMVKLSVISPDYWLIRSMLSIQKGTGEELILKTVLAFSLGAFVLYGISICLFRREEVSYEE